METLTQIKDRVAQKHGYDNWDNMILNEVHNCSGYEVIKQLEDEAMQEYANTRCIRQRELCADSATASLEPDLRGGEWVIVDEDSILTAKLATEE